MSTSQYLTNDIPVLLKSEGLSCVSDVLSVIFENLPANADDFIKWTAEIKRQEENGSNLSNEEKGRLAVKEEVLQQVRETALFELVTNWLSSARACCRNVPLSKKDALSEIAASTCCQGAAMLSGVHGATEGFCCRETSVKCPIANGDEHATVISGTVVSGGIEQGVDMLVPISPRRSRSCSSSISSNYIATHPASNDVLTVLLLALPPNTWLGIKDEKLLAEVHGLVSTENLPNVLQEEVLNLREQLLFLKKCKDKEVDDDFVFPSST